MNEKHIIVHSSEDKVLPILLKCLKAVFLKQL